MAEANETAAVAVEDPPIQHLDARARHLIARKLRDRLGFMDPDAVAQIMGIAGNGGLVENIQAENLIDPFASQWKNLKKILDFLGIQRDQIERPRSDSAD